MKFTTHSIKKDLALMVLLIFGVSCIVLATVCTTSVSKALIAQKDTSFEQTAVIQAQQMSEWFNTQKRLLDELALAVHSNGYDTEKFDDAVPFLADMTAIDSSIYAIYMGRADKSCIFSDAWDAVANNYDPTTRDWYTDAVAADATVISAPYVDAATGEMVITLSEPIKDSAGKTTAILAVDVFVTTVVEIAESVVDDTSYPVLVDSDNNIIVHKNTAFIPSVDSGGNEILTSADNLFSNNSSSDTAVFKATDYAGTNSIVVNVPVGNTGWQYYLVVPSTVYYKEVNSLVGNFVLIFIVFLIIDTLVIAKAVAHKLKPLGELVGAAESMTAGNLSYSSTYNTDDEIGRVCSAVSSANCKISSYIKDIDDNLAAMADGSFDKSIDMEYVGDFAKIHTSLTKIQSALKQTLQKIDAVTEQVTNGAELVANGAQELSQGAVQQAEAVDKLTHSADSFGKKLEETFESTDTANAVVNAMNTKVAECNSSMQRLNDAMNNISDTTEQIRLITKTVEDIAFQTNILALNAAVEAARAGAAGKGFAVVADEVRNLASKSAEAANTTTQLIEKSCDAVANGVTLTEETTKKLAGIVGDTQEMQEHIQKISENAADEKTELGNITAEIDVISAVVQTNTAAAEESAASSEELSGQAIALKEMLSGFKL